MMEKVVLHATRRTVTGKKVGVLRREGLLPAVLYGHKVESTPITLPLKETQHAMASLTGSSLIYVELEGKENAVLVREKQRDFLRGTLRHVDFQVVSLTEKIHADVNIVLSGVSPAVKDYNGVVVEGVTSVEVECLPTELPERFIIDISNLKRIGDGIYVRDLVVSEKVAILEEPEEMVVIISASEQEEAVETEGAAAEPEVVQKGKKEEEVED